MTDERNIQDSPVPTGDKERIRTIRKAIMAESKAIRARYPLLDRFQNQIGLTILLSSLTAMGLTGYLYVQGAISAWLAIPLIAFITSIAHEIEHDAIHKAYFPKSKAIGHFIFATVWFMRPGTVSPWARKHLHLAHHKISGTRGDIEERSITNGEKMGIKRIIMMADGFLSVLLRIDWSNKKRARTTLKSAFFAYLPLGVLHFTAWWAFLSYHGIVALGAVFGADLAATGTIASLVGLMNIVVVIFVAPHFLRSLCINFVSSNMHYFGDVEAGNVIKQTQIIDSWLFLPFHLFCFNFGKTHGLHHFWAADPFYIRQMTAKNILPVMIENGVRVNDFANMKRSNRHTIKPAIELVSVTAS
jgi:fatty acid desaturase